MTGPAAAHRHDADALATSLRDGLPAPLSEWLATRRWFADKGHAIARVEIEDILVTWAGEGWVALTIVRIHFQDGTAARYFLPLAVTRSDGDAILTTALGNEALGAVDASETAWFGGWFLQQLSERVDFGEWGLTADPSAEDLLGRARAFPARVMGAEQSNTSLRYDDALIVKLIRRLQPAPNPDEEMLRALSAAGFPNVPHYAGGAVWRDGRGVEYPIALAQAFVPNDGDGWSWMLRRLGAIASGTFAPDCDAMAAEQLLGRRTAEMHVVLARLQGLSFTPVKPDAATIAADADRVRAAALVAAELLEQRRDGLPGRVRAQLPRVARALDEVGARADGFQEEGGTNRIRVHGDYHLGQTLRTIDGDWIIVDFEGEPARPVAERRQKLSALKDVAGMLRSFGYARGAAERAVPAESADARERLRQWESGAREAFLAGYRGAIGDAAVGLVPGDDIAFERALAAWELDKALYEIAYEARNRPDWLELPLRALLPEAKDQAEGAAPGAPAYPCRGAHAR